MSSKQERRRSGVFNTDQPVVKTSRWTSRGNDKHSTADDNREDEQQREKEKEKKRSHRASAATASRSLSKTISRRPSMPSSLRSTAASDARADAEGSTGSFTPYTTTTIVAGSRSPSSSYRSRRHADRDRAKSPPGSRSGSISVPFFGRSSSMKNKKRNGSDAMTERDNLSHSRPRTATLEDGRRDQSPTAVRGKSRSRYRDAPSSGAEFLASVPMSTNVPSAPSISSLGSPVQSPSPQPGARSISPMSSGTADSITSALPSANARRILHLMRTLNGRMSGSVIFRRGFGNPWSQSYCYIHEENGSLMYESRGSEGAHKVLVPDLRGSSVRSNLDGDLPYLELSLPQSSDEVHIKLQTQSDFDAWFAALLHWTPRDTNSESSNEPRPESEMGSTRASSADVSQHEVTHRRASVNNPISTRERAGSDRRKSIISGVTKENPVIKIGKMIYWDTNVGYSNNSAALGQPSTRRPSTSRMQSVSSRRWRRISGQLRENGELKLHSDADNSLISVVQLSQLSRCAIQRLDASVLESDFCIAIYPQYTSSYTNTQPGFVRPIFLSLESRVLYEVWFVLLRAFTMPSIYGPRVDVNEEDQGDDSANRDLESMIATSTTYTFRMERSLSVKIAEAKMQFLSAKDTDGGFSGGFIRQQASIPPEKYGYYAEVLLDNETRGKTVAKYDGLNPLWSEHFEFQDLPPVLNNASIVVKRRPPEQNSGKDHNDTKSIRDAFGEQQGGFTNLAHDVVCGKVEIQMEELEPEKDVEKWWPVLNVHGQRVGEILIKVRADEGIILMARDYEQLSAMLHRFSNALTLHIAQMIPSELKRLSDSLLNIFQVSGTAGDWIMALVEEEIDGSHKDSPITRLRYTRRAGSMENNDSHGNGGGNGGSTDREMIVRDLNKNATLEANLLFRGNTLLTKSLDTHMRRVGKEYLEESLAITLQDINDQDLDCEVDPNRVHSASDLDRNWKRLSKFTRGVWDGIVANRSRCPIELKIIFRHVRACAEDRYGDFLRSVSYSSVSGFLFLRFFCPAVLNPKLFGLLQDDIKPRARRTFTLIAKSLQTMANMASFGTKEPWMEPMNTFLVQNREGFKTFIDDVCHIPASASGAAYPNSSTSPTYPPGVVSAEQHLSYTTPMTIMQRLPPSSREGFPSLPYLVDQARSFAGLIHLWLDAIAALSSPGDAATLPGKSHADILHAISSTEGDLKDFHRLCEELNTRTQECLNRAERAERPDSPHSFQWEDVINQLQKAQLKNTSGIDTETSTLVEEVDSNPAIEATLRQLRGQDEEMDEDAPIHGVYSDQAMSRTEPALVDSTPRSHNWGRPGSATPANNSFHGSAGRNYSSQSMHGSPSQSASNSVSNVSSAVSSDTEHTTTALPNYEREVRHRERREQARFQIQKEVEASRTQKEKDKEKKKSTKLIPNLRKKKEKEKDGLAKTKTNGDGMI